MDLRRIACGSNASASGNVRWDDSSLSGRSIIGDGTATLRAEGGITRLELAGHYHSGTGVGVTWAVTATLTGGETLPAGTYACGQDAVAGYLITVSPASCWALTPTADCPGQVASCTFTLDEQIWPGCFEANAKGTFSLTLTGTDAGTVAITDGTFDVPIVEPVAPR